MDARGAVAIVALVIAGLTGCAGSGGDEAARRRRRGCTPPPPADQSVSFASNVQPIFNRSCALAAACHLGAAAAGALDLSVGESHEELVDEASSQQPALRLVAPGRPDDSYLVRKIEGGPAIAGALMPQGCPGTPQQGAQCLTPDDIEAIRTWITECATEN
jgi:hypothetical protein